MEVNETYITMISSTSDYSLCLESYCDDRKENSKID